MSYGYVLNNGKRVSNESAVQDASRKFHRTGMVDPLPYDQRKAYEQETRRKHAIRQAILDEEAERRRADEKSRNEAERLQVEERARQARAHAEAKRIHAEEQARKAREHAQAQARREEAEAKAQAEAEARAQAEAEARAQAAEARARAEAEASAQAEAEARARESAHARAHAAAKARREQAEAQARARREQAEADAAAADARQRSHENAQAEMLLLRRQAEERAADLAKQAKAADEAHARANKAALAAMNRKRVELLNAEAMEARKRDDAKQMKEARARDDAYVAEDAKARAEAQKRLEHAKSAAKAQQVRDENAQASLARAKVVADARAAQDAEAKRAREERARAAEDDAVRRAEDKKVADENARVRADVVAQKRAVADGEKACRALERNFHATHVSFPYAKQLKRGSLLPGFDELAACYAAETIPMAYCKPGVSEGCVQRVVPSSWDGMQVFLRRSDKHIANMRVVVELNETVDYVYAMRLTRVDDLRPSVASFLVVPRKAWAAHRADYKLLSNAATDDESVYVLSAVRRALESSWTAGTSPLDL